MKAAELAEVILRKLPSYVGTNDQRMAQALNEGAAMVMAEYYPRLGSSAWTPRHINAWREAFTFWKSAAAAIVSSSQWLRSAPGYRNEELAKAVAAWPGYVMAKERKLFLTLLENNAFLGWNPNDEQKLIINQLRWDSKNTPLPGKGLAVDRMTPGRTLAQAQRPGSGRRY